MVDTIHLRLPMQEIAGYEGWFEDVASNPNLENVTRSVKPNGYKTFFGNLGNLRFSISPRGVNIKGSMPKFVYGNNLIEPGREMIVEFIDAIWDALGIDVSQGILTRIDFGKNIRCDLPPTSYIRLFTDSQHFERHTHPHSIHYINGNRQFIMYDKMVEAKKNKEPIPEEFAGVQVIRLEARWMNSAKIKRCLKDEARLANVGKKAGWKTLAKEWKKLYFHFQRETEVCFDSSRIKKPKDMTDWLTCEGLKASGGIAGLNQYIQTLKDAHAFRHPAYYSNLKRNKKKLLKKFADGKGNPLLDELDAKVRDAFYLIP
jgi:hypothetical protein